MKTSTTTFFIFTSFFVTFQASVVKRQITFPNDDSESGPRTVSDRYGFLGGWPGFFGQPFNPGNFGFNNFGGNPFQNQFYPQNHQFYPQTQQFFPQNQQQNFPQSGQQNQVSPQNQQVRPQNQPQNQQNQQVVSTTVSPQVQACIDSCVESTPGQYNPWCGSDDQTYHNEERLNCVIECGQNIRASYRGVCSRPTIPPWQMQ